MASKMNHDHFESWVRKINLLVEAEKVTFKKHCTLRMRQRSISVNEFKEAMKKAEIVEYYEDDYPFPSALILGYTSAERPLHAVVSLGQGNGILWVITLYEPSTKLWSDNFKKRRG
ncbi:MAG: DUF4258 domain-containing protein [Desulfonatronovibrio sp.]